ncbi:hypothetical protein P7C73_g2022, partial [Tremellales sp. Uapishka_1]
MSSRGVRFEELPNTESGGGTNAETTVETTAASRRARRSIPGAFPSSDSGSGYDSPVGMAVDSHGPDAVSNEAADAPRDLSTAPSTRRLTEDDAVHSDAGYTERSGSVGLPSSIERFLLSGGRSPGSSQSGSSGYRQPYVEDGSDDESVEISSSRSGGSQDSREWIRTRDETRTERRAEKGTGSDLQTSGATPRRVRFSEGPSDPPSRGRLSSARDILGSLISRLTSRPQATRTDLEEEARSMASEDINITNGEQDWRTRSWGTGDRPSATFAPYSYSGTYPTEAWRGRSFPAPRTGSFGSRGTPNRSYLPPDTTRSVTSALPTDTSVYRPRGTYTAGTGTDPGTLTFVVDKEHSNSALFCDLTEYTKPGDANPLVRVEVPEGTTIACAFSTHENLYSTTYGQDNTRDTHSMVEKSDWMKRKISDAFQRVAASNATESRYTSRVSTGNPSAPSSNGAPRGLLDYLSRAASTPSSLGYRVF